jgi:hypothetical protein
VSSSLWRSTASAGHLSSGLASKSNARGSRDSGAAPSTRGRSYRQFPRCALRTAANVDVARPSEGPR